MLDLTDKKIINALQKGLPITSRPFESLAKELNITSKEIVDRVSRLKENSYMSRFGPLYNIEVFGGVFLLAAMDIPEDQFDKITEVVNSFPEVAHNYKRNHQLNMWFVLAVEKKSDLQPVCSKIEEATGFRVFQMPKLKEFYVNLFFDVLGDGSCN